MKKLQVTLAILMLLLGVASFNIKNAYAWHNTPVQTSTAYHEGETVAKMGTTTQYGYIGPAGDRHPHFYSALIASGKDTIPIWRPQTMKIEVSGTDPLGTPLTGDRFGGFSVYLSPDDSGVEQTVLTIIYDVLVNNLPIGLEEIVKNTQSPGGASTSYDGEKAWGVWDKPPLATALRDRGLRFGYNLVVDTTIEGTYTINIHHHTTIYGYGMDGRVYFVKYLDHYETVQYTYVNTPLAPSRPDGRGSGYTYTTYTYSTSTTDPNGDSLRYQFYWGDGSYTLTGWYTSSATASASHSWSSTGYKYVKVRAQDSTGAWSDWSSSLTVYISSGGGGGGCPILSVYDGTMYALEGLLDIHNPDGIDEITSHVLIHTPEPVEHRYLMRLTEHPQTYSHLDQVQLFAMLTNGTEVKLPLVSAIHSEDGNVKQELLVSDDVRAVMLGEDWNNGTSQYIDLKFVAPDEELEIETFTFIIEGHNVPEKMAW